MSAISEPGKRARVIEIQGSLVFPYSIVLPPDCQLRGANRESCFIGFSNGDGIGLTANNEVSNLTIQTNPSFRAIYALSDRQNLETIKLNSLVITGQVQTF
jgi:hypothetical protein